MDISTDPSCCSIRDPDMTLSSSLSLEDTWKSQVATKATQISMAPVADLGHKHGHRLQPKHWASLFSLVEVWVMDDHTDPDMALGGSPGSDVTIAPSGKQVSHISLFLTTFISFVLPLSTAHELLHFCFISHFSTTYLLIIMHHTSGGSHS